METNFVKKMANSALSSLWHSKTEWDSAVYMYMHDLIAPLMPLYRVKILVKISPVVLVENRLTDKNCVACSCRCSTANAGSCYSYCKVHDIMRLASDNLT